MRVYDLAAAVATTGAQTAIDLPSQTDRDWSLLQIKLSSTGSVTVEGQIDPGMSWTTIGGPYTVDMIDRIFFVPRMRLNIASNAGAITAKVAVY